MSLAWTIKKPYVRLASFPDLPKKGKEDAVFSKSFIVTWGGAYCKIVVLITWSRGSQLYVTC